MNIFFDLDGTLIDSRLRLYNLFQDLVPLSKLSFDEYWDLKRNKFRHRKILEKYFSFSDLEISLFESKWLTLIETSKYLLLDEPFDGVTDFLKHTSENNDLHIITDRQFPWQVTTQIDRFGWQKFFKNIFVTQQRMEKFELILESKGLIIRSDDLFVGDTGKDIQNGKKLGIKTVAVLSGFLNKKALIEYTPDTIIENIVNLKI